MSVLSYKCLFMYILILGYNYINTNMYYYFYVSQCYYGCNLFYSYLGNSEIRVAGCITRAEYE